MYDSAEEVRNRLIAIRNKLPGHEAYSAGLIVWAAGQRWSYGAGAARALWRLGFQGVFKLGLGISAGLPILVYLLVSPRPLRGAALCYRHTTAKKYIDPMSLHIETQPLAERIVADKKSCSEFLLTSLRTDLWVGVCTEEGKSVLINSKAAPLKDLMKAALTVPGLSGEPVEVNGVKYYDGAMSPPSLKAVIEEWQREYAINTFVVLPNIPKRSSVDSRLTFGDLLVEKLLKRRHELLGEGYRRGWQQFSDDLEFVESGAGGAKVWMVWPPDCGLGIRTREGDLLRRALHASRRDVELAFSRHGISV